MNKITVLDATLATLRRVGELDDEGRDIAHFFIGLMVSYARGDDEVCEAIDYLVDVLDMDASADIGYVQ